MTAVYAVAVFMGIAVARCSPDRLTGRTSAAMRKRHGGRCCAPRPYKLAGSMAARGLLASPGKITRRIELPQLRGADILPPAGAKPPQRGFGQTCPAMPPVKGGVLTSTSLPQERTRPRADCRASKLTGLGRLTPARRSFLAVARTQIAWTEDQHANVRRLRVGRGGLHHCCSPSAGGSAIKFRSFPAPPRTLTRTSRRHNGGRSLGAYSGRAERTTRSTAGSTPQRPMLGTAFRAI